MGSYNVIKQASIIGINRAKPAGGRLSSSQSGLAWGQSEYVENVPTDRNKTKFLFHISKNYCTKKITRNILFI